MTSKEKDKRLSELPLSLYYFQGQLTLKLGNALLREQGGKWNMYTEKKEDLMVLLLQEEITSTEYAARIKILSLTNSLLRNLQGNSVKETWSLTRQFLLERDFSLTLQKYQPLLKELD